MCQVYILMAVLVRVMKIHIGNVINRPPQQNAPMFRVLTSFISNEIEWGFRKKMSTKSPPYGAPGSIGTSRSICAVCRSPKLKHTLANIYVYFVRDSAGLHMPLFINS